MIRPLSLAIQLYSGTATVALLAGGAGSGRGSGRVDSSMRTDSGCSCKQRERCTLYLCDASVIGLDCVDDILEITQHRLQIHYRSKVLGNPDSFMFSMNTQLC